MKTIIFFILSLFLVVNLQAEKPDFEKQTFEKSYCSDVSIVSDMEADYRSPGLVFNQTVFAYTTIKTAKTKDIKYIYRQLVSENNKYLYSYVLVDMCDITKKIYLTTVIQDYNFILNDKPRYTISYGLRETQN